MERLRRAFVFFALVPGFVGVLFWPTTSSGISGASLTVGPASGTFSVGSIFTVSIYLNTGGNSVNAVEANLSFPPDKLQVVTPSAGKSLIQIWVSQPAYSNEEGTLKFQGTIPSPGINTESGLISTVTFRVKSTGSATLKLLDSSRVLLNDGRGTDVLGQRGSGIYSLVLPPPAGPVVTSPSHPDQENWYKDNNVVFRWESFPDIEGFSYVLNDSPVDIPDDISEGLKTGVTYNNLADGVHYFHIKSLRDHSWGGVTHYVVNIDKTPPSVFEVGITPSDRTSNRNPLFEFGTTDQVSGIDHYEIKIIPLEKSEQEGLPNETPFFVEATSPYSRHLELGRYDVVVRAYDRASNFTQSSKKLAITKAIFEVVKGEGLNFRGSFVIPWFWVWLFGILGLGVLVYFGRLVWIWHRQVEKHLEAGAFKHPDIAPKLEELKNKQKEYKSGGSTNLLIIGIILLISSFAAGFSVQAKASERSVLPVEPPVVTLFPKSVSNDEILYIGGRAGAPDAEVVVYIQSEGNGEAISYSVRTDKNGEWFLSLPDFLNPGKYSAWTQLRVGERLSPPSSKLDIEVAKTAIQLGEKRISYESFYFVLFIILLGALLALGAFLIYHSYHHKIKKAKLTMEIQEAEESIRRGFVILRKDIEAELELVRRTKLTKGLEAEERLREEKLIRDLEWVNSYIGKEVWEVEKRL